MRRLAVLLVAVPPAKYEEINMDDVLFKIAATLVVLMSAVLVGVIFAYLIFGAPGWIMACYGIIYCAGTGFMADKFIVPHMTKKEEEPTDEE